MIANFFDKTKPINFLVLSILAFLIFTISVVKTNTDPYDVYFFAKNSVFLFVCIISVFVMNFIIRKNSLSDDNTYAILFYILLSGLFPYTFNNGGVYLSNFILLFAFRRIYSLRTSLSPKEKIFDSAFWIGVASMFYLWSFAYLLLLFAAILVFRKAVWRNFLIPILGLATPVFLAYSYFLAFDDVERFLDFWNWDYLIDFSVYQTFDFLAPMILIGLMILFSIFPTTRKSLLAKIDFKSTWQLLILHIILSLLVAIIAPLKNGSEFSFLFFPLSILFANYLQYIERYWIKEGIIYLFIITYFMVTF